MVRFRAESHNIYHLTTKDTRIHDIIPTKTPNSVVKRINRLIMPIYIHTVVKGVEPCLLGHSISLPLLVPMQIGCQLDQTDDQPEKKPTLIEIPLQTD